MLEVVISDAEPPARWRRVVGDEDVGILNQSVEYRAARFLPQIERQTPFVARVEEKTRVERRPPRHRVPAPAVGVAHAGRLDLDHFGAKIRHHRRRRRPGDKAGAIDDFQSVEDAFAHPNFLSTGLLKFQTSIRYASPSLTMRPAVAPAKCVPITSTGRLDSSASMRSRVRCPSSGSLSAVEHQCGRAI